MDLGDLIERLRQDELDSVRADVREGRVDHALKSLDERGGAQELVQQQYSGRYPFELLQNANDSMAVGQEGSVVFLVTDAALLIGDQGAGFQEEEIRAICGLGRSSKDPRKSVGYKGLGFKSVGEITKRPQILTADVRFEFDEGTVRQDVEAITGHLLPGQRLPLYAFPTLALDESLGADALQIEELLGQGYRTIVRLPFKDGVTRDDVAVQVEQSVQPRLLLFLESVESLRLRGTSGDFGATAIREQKDDHTELLIEVDGSTEHWLTFKETCEIPDASLVAGLGLAWSTVDQVSVGAAVALDEDGMPRGARPEPVHVYFPTEETTGLPILLQGDFALELDRRRIAQNPEARAYNEWLAERLAETLATTVVPSLVDRYGAGPGPAAAFAVLGEPIGFAVQIIEKAVDRLRDIPFLACSDGGVRRASEVRLLPESAPSADVVHRYADLESLSVVIPELEDRPPIRRLLDELLQVPSIDAATVVGRLGQPLEEEVLDFYSMLVVWRTKEVKLGQHLAQVPCVQTARGVWKEPEGLFFPRQREQVEFPDEIDVPIVAIPELEGLDSLLEEAGVRQFEWRALLPEFVLPILQDPGSVEKKRHSAFEALRAYFQSERSGDPRLRARIERVLLPASRARESEVELRPAREIYFSKAWTGDTRLEEIYGPFGEAEFLALDPSEDVEERAADEEFLTWVGVSRWPRVNSVEAERDQYMTHSLARHPHLDIGDYWGAWIDSQVVREAMECEQGHPFSQQLRRSFLLDRLEAVAASADVQRLVAFWSMLAEGWGRVYQPSMKAEFYCQNTGHGGERSRFAPSLIAFMLNDLQWVPALYLKEGSLRRPSDVWRRSHETPARVAARVPILPDELTENGGIALAEAVGVVDAARLAPKDLARLLELLATEAELGDEGDASELHRAARWGMRQLEDSLYESPDVHLNGVNLLARHDGATVFVTDPVVARDPLLGDAWSRVVPVLDADRDVRQLPRVLGLRVLDDEVVVRAVPENRDWEAEKRIEETIGHVGPYLAAIAVREVPSRRDDVLRGLRRLSVVASRHLLLRYHWDEHVIEREDAVAYISVEIRQEGSARRAFGTAYLEVGDDGSPDWFTFGPQLASHLGVPTMGDAFSLLLSSPEQVRRQFLVAKRITDETISEMQTLLGADSIDVDLVESLATRLEAVSVQTPDAAISRSNEGAADDEAGESGREALSEDEHYPELDISSAEIKEARTGEGGVSWTGSNRHKRTLTLGPGGASALGLVHVRREIGERGEQWVFALERRRMEEEGQDPSSVVWVSKQHPLAPYDFESLRDGQKIYIEVKATKGSDPYSPFDISEAELLFAMQHRDQYVIYRVIEAHTATPTIWYFRDPIGLLQEGSAGIRLSGAKLWFQPADQPDHAAAGAP